jgi:hypothetical protein
VGKKEVLPMISEIPREEPEDPEVDLEQLVRGLQATPGVVVSKAILETLVSLAVTQVIFMHKTGFLHKLPPPDLYNFLAPIAWASERFPSNPLIRLWEAAMDATKKRGENPE